MIYSETPQSEIVSSKPYRYMLMNVRVLFYAINLALQDVSNAS